MLSEPAFIAHEIRHHAESIEKLAHHLTVDLTPVNGTELAAMEARIMAAIRSQHGISPHDQDLLDAVAMKIAAVATAITDLVDLAQPHPPTPT